MADENHVAILKQGVDVWNKWRGNNRDVRTDLSEADLSNKDLSDANFHSTDLHGADMSGANISNANFHSADLSSANLSRVDLHQAKLNGANLRGATLRDADLGSADFSRSNLLQADLSGADLRQAVLNSTNFSGANLRWANLRRANIQEGDISSADLRDAIFSKADLRKANLQRATLTSANLSGANLSEADLSRANLTKVNFREANLHKTIFCEADLREVDLHEANLSNANLRGANLGKATLIDTNLSGANLSGCSVFGISAWKLNIEGATQSDLVITEYGEPVITVDNLEVAQFVYLILNNKKLRGVIDTLTTKSVLILGRFTDERKAILDAIREELRRRDYVPILFDFKKPDNRDLTETVMTLASLSRFVIVDLSDPNSSPHEIMSFAKDFPSIPLKPIFCPTKEHPNPYPMFEDHLRRFTNVLPIYRYETAETLIPLLGEKVIEPAEAKVKEMKPGSI